MRSKLICSDSIRSVSLKYKKTFGRAACKEMKVDQCRRSGYRQVGYAELVRKQNQDAKCYIKYIKYDPIPSRGPDHDNLEPEIFLQLADCFKQFNHGHSLVEPRRAGRIGRCSGSQRNSVANCPRSQPGGSPGAAAAGKRECRKSPDALSRANR